MPDKKYNSRKYLRHYKGTSSSTESVYLEVGTRAADVLEMHRTKFTLHSAGTPGHCIVKRKQSKEQGPYQS